MDLQEQILDLEGMSEPPKLDKFTENTLNPICTGVKFRSHIRGCPPPSARKLHQVVHSKFSLNFQKNHI